MHVVDRVLYNVSLGCASLMRDDTVHRRHNQSARLWYRCAPADDSYSQHTWAEQMVRGLSSNTAICPLQMSYMSPQSASDTVVRPVCGTARNPRTSPVRRHLICIIRRRNDCVMIVSPPLLSHRVCAAALHGHTAVDCRVCGIAEKLSSIATQRALTRTMRRRRR